MRLEFVSPGLLSALYRRQQGRRDRGPASLSVMTSGEASTMDEKERENTFPRFGGGPTPPLLVKFLYWKMGGITVRSDSKRTRRTGQDTERERNWDTF